MPKEAASRVQVWLTAMHTVGQRMPATDDQSALRWDAKTSGVVKPLASTAPEVFACGKKPATVNKVPEQPAWRRYRGFPVLYLSLEMVTVLLMSPTEKLISPPQARRQKPGAGRAVSGRT